MWETAELGSEDLLWASTNFIAGIARQQEAVCGAISGGAIYLGLRHRCPLADREKANQARTIAREQARELVLDFTREHGNIICGNLTGISGYDAETIQRFRDSGEWTRKCVGYVQYVIKKLYELETQ